MKDSSRSICAVIVLLSALLCACVAVWLAPANSFDPTGGDFVSFYDHVAIRISTGQGIAESGHLATRYPPGYPLYLALLYRVATALHTARYNAIVAGNVLLFGYASLLLFLLSSRVWGMMRALATAACAMTYPLFLAYLMKPSTELPFLVLVLLALTLVWRGLAGPAEPWLLLFAAGMLCGFASLVRPMGVALSVVLAVFWLVASRRSGWVRLSAAGLLLLGNLFAVAPWEWKMHESTGRWQVLSTYGVRSIRDGLTFAVELKGYRNAIAVPERSREAMRYFRRRYDDIADWAGLRDVVTEEASRNPAGVAELLLLKVARSWYGTDSGRYEGMLLAIQLPYLALVIWSTRRCLAAGSNARRMAFLMWLLTAYFWAMSVLVLSIARYMAPSMTLLFTTLPALWPARATADQPEAIARAHASAV